MQLRSIRFNPVLGASGVQNFFGGGYWYHKLFRLIPGFSFKGMTFVAKTVTADQRVGNMFMMADGVTPSEWIPRCIWVNLSKGVTINAVGLTNDGISPLLERGVWQQRTDPFWMSFMPVGARKEMRLAEARAFVVRVQEEKPNFSAPFGLQFNGSCPNQKGVSEEEMLAEALEIVEILAQLEVPIMYKLCVTTRPEQIKPLTEHPALDAITVTNAVPFGELPDRIDWHGIIGQPKHLKLTDKLSPLYVPVGMKGALSGPPLLPIVCDWISEAREIGITTHINGGGGIFSRDDVTRIAKAGADSISIGTVAMHRPWRLKGIIRQGHRAFS